MKVTMVAHTDLTEKLVASAAKLCYSANTATEVAEKAESMTDGQIGAYINMLRDLHHESPLEHISFTFAIEGVSRACSHQFVRHRLASYSQKSQRYVDESQFHYVTPRAIGRSTQATARFCAAMRRLADDYTYLRDTLTLDYLQEKYPDLATEDLLDKANPQDVTAARKAAQEDARFVLPNACETQFFVTMNARELLHFFQKRCCNRAQWEIRAVADEMLTQCQQVAPNIFANAGAPCVSGKCPEGKLSCGKPRA